MEIPKNLLYTEEHEWTEVEGDTATIGITQFAVDQLGDITLVELPETGGEIQAGEPMGTVESVKAVSDLYASVSGTVTAVNEKLEEEPELVNDDPFGEGWMIKVKLADKDEVKKLMDAEAYGRHCEEGGED
jgi:glycine cleavage system H protein